MRIIRTIYKTGRQWALAGCLALSLAGTASAAEQTYSGMVVFGTSLSDPGNGFAIRGGTNTPPAYALDFPYVPNAPYARGGHHLSNGETWVEQLAKPLGLARNAQPAFRGSNPNASNYAVDRARAYDDGINVNLSTQVARFLEDHGGVAAPGSLYVIEIGSNDVRDALAAYVLGGDGSIILQRALSSIGANFVELYAAGAREFLVTNVPDLALTPSVRILDQIHAGAGIAPLAHTLVVSFNANLAGVWSQLPADAHLVQLDVFHKLNDVIAHPAAFGFTNVTAPCITPDVPPFTCQHPDHYLFWDGIHPTQAGHAVMAREAYSVLSH